MKKDCKCNGVSGSCTLKTCWMSLPQFRQVGDRLVQVYERAKLVEPIRGQRTLSPIFLKLKRSANSQKKPPWKELVYLAKSPDYCERNSSYGSFGTRGRQCNRTGTGNDRCDHICCGRGFDTRVERVTKQCDCKFHWCCYVTCRECEAWLEYSTCK